MFSEYLAIKNNYVAICSRLCHFLPYIDWTINLVFVLHLWANIAYTQTVLFPEHISETDGWITFILHMHII